MARPAVRIAAVSRSSAGSELSASSLSGTSSAFTSISSSAARRKKLLARRLAKKYCCAKHARAKGIAPMREPQRAIHVAKMEGRLARGAATRTKRSRRTTSSGNVTCTHRYCVTAVAAMTAQTMPVLTRARRVPILFEMCRALVIMRLNWNIPSAAMRTMIDPLR